MRTGSISGQSGPVLGTGTVVRPAHFAYNMADNIVVSVFTSMKITHPVPLLYCAVRLSAPCRPCGQCPSYMHASIQLLFIPAHRRTLELRSGLPQSIYVVWQCTLQITPCRAWSGHTPPIARGVRVRDGLFQAVSRTHDGVVFVVAAIEQDYTATKQGRALPEDSQRYILLQV